jgi:hypothetical protein
MGRTAFLRRYAGCGKATDALLTTTADSSTMQAGRIRPRAGDCGAQEGKNAMYKIFMIVGAVVVGAGWIAYAIWDYKMRQEEKKQPKKRSARLQKTQGEMADWAKKMAEFKKPMAKRQARGDQNDDA